MDIAEPVGVGAGLGLCEQLGAFDIGGEDGLERRRVTGGRFLSEVAEAGAARHFDGAFVRLDLADDGLDQRGLAGTVAPDKADAGAGRDGGRGAGNDVASAEAHGDAVDGKHEKRTRPLRKFRENRARESLSYSPDVGKRS